MTSYPQQKGRGYGHMSCVCRDAARRAGLSATAELPYFFKLHICKTRTHQEMR